MDKELEVAWAAGLFEGEGCITRNLSHGKSYRKLSMNMTDKDVMQKFVDIIGYGNLNGPYYYSGDRAHCKPRWQWEIGRKGEVLRALKLLLPYFGERRAEKATEAINHLQ